MIRYSVPRAILFALLFLSLLPAQSFAGCNVAIVSNIAPTDPNGTITHGQITVTPAVSPAILQRESTTERASDVLIYDDLGGGNCFASGNKILLTYTGVLTNPPTFPVSTSIDVYDSAGNAGLNLTGHSSAGLGASPSTVLEIDVVSAGTAAVAAGGITASATGSAVRVKNLRFDATQLAAGAFLAVTVSATSNMAAAVTANVGVALDTVAAGAGVVQDGVGFQSAGGTLTTPAIFDYAENYPGAFRVASDNATGVWGDVPTTATRVIFDLGTSLPQGVSVTFPSLIQVGGATGITLTLRSGGSCSGPVQCTAIYDTTWNGGTGPFDLKTTTAATPNTGQDGNLPALGVFIANPSGFGIVTMTVNVVPAHMTSLADAPVKVFSMALIGSGASTGSGPSISNISPNTLAAGTTGATITVNGSNFTNTSVVQWNGSARTTTYVSSTQLLATVTTADLATAGTASVTVLNGTTASNAATFTISATGSTTPQQYVLPHFISGAGYGSKLTIVNTSTQQNSVVVTFYSQAGGTLSTTTYNMAPGAAVRVATTDTERFGTYTTKWVTVNSQAAVLSNVWYDYLSGPGATAIGNSVGFEDAAPQRDFSLPVEFQPSANGGFSKTVGLAIANPNASGTTATIKLVDSTGNVLATQSVVLPAYGQTAIDLSQASVFGSSLPSTDFVGSVTVSATSPVSSIAVQDSDGLFSAVPVGAGRAK